MKCFFGSVQRIALLLLVISSATPALASDPMHDAFTYQGQLRHNGEPVAGPINLAFRLFDASVLGDQVGPELLAPGFAGFDDDGRFTIDLELGSSVFVGAQLWLEIAVDGTILQPRQPLMPTPYAMVAGTAANVPTKALVGTYSGITGVGQLSELQVNGNIQVSGWVGTTATAPFVIHTNDMPSFRILPAFNDGFYRPNMIGGGPTNAMTDASLSGATISGGSHNTVGAIGSFIGGGFSNVAAGIDSVVAGGTVNEATGSYSMIGGGYSNLATGLLSVIAGGKENSATGVGSTVGGGQFNVASDTLATVSGGNTNSATGHAAMVPGGILNRAGGLTSMAAGYRAKADHDGTFVWADSINVDFLSTGPNQFLIRANGGVGIGTNNPLANLHLARTGGNINMLLKRNDATHGINVGVNEQPKMFFGRTAGDGIYDDIMVIDGSVTGGRVGVGTTNPLSRLHVNLSGNSSWSQGNGWGDFSVSNGGVGLGVGVTSTGPNAGTVRLWPKGGAETLILGSPGAGDLMRLTNDGRIAVGLPSGLHPFATMEVYTEGDVQSALRVRHTGGFSGHFISDTTTGLIGWCLADSGSGAGVLGETLSSEGTGVSAGASSPSGMTRGVWARVESPDGWAGYFTGGRNYFEGNVGIGTPTPMGRLHVAGGHALFAERVGIGTVSPSHPLHVHATTSAAVRITGPGSFGTNAILQFQDDFGAVRLHNDTDGTLIINSLNRTALMGGNVGINTLSPSSFRLAVNGTAANSTGSWSVFSDARLKHNIEPLEHGTLEQLLALRGCTFEYEDHAIENRLALPGKQVGLIAQEVQSVFPDWVDADDEGYLYITERGTTALLVEALRELRAEKDAQVSALERENENLRVRLNSLENLMAEFLAAQQKGNDR